MSKRVIEEKVERIVRGGTKIVSFTYEGERRNVLVGSAIADGKPIWGKQKNRGIRKLGGRTFLCGLDNLDGRRFKVFSAAKIRNLSV